MKKQLTVILVLIGFMFFCSINSCIVVTQKDNGKHKGWNKNPNNPHYKNSQPPIYHNNSHEKPKGNPNEKSKGKSKGKGHSKGKTK